MSPTFKQLCALLSIVMMLMALVSPLVASVVDDQSSNDTCCADEVACESGSEPNSTTQPLEQDCCPSGCDDCFLQCCNGLVSIHSFAMTFDTHRLSHYNWPETYTLVLPTHPRGIFHPPRN